MLPKHGVVLASNDLLHLSLHLDLVYQLVPRIVLPFYTSQVITTQ